MDHFKQRTRYGFAIPQVFVDEAPNTNVISKLVRTTEQLGFDSLWTQDQVIGRAQTLEPLSLLSFVCALTQRIKIGVSVLVFAHRHPVLLAKTIASMDHLSNGRLLVGLGLGRHGPQEAVFGIRHGERRNRFNEGLRIMRALWQTQSVGHAGRYWTLNATSQSPGTLQQPHPPIWFGGAHPNALRRAVCDADGWMGAGSSTITQFAHQARQIHEYLEQAGRDRNSFTISKRLYIAIDNNQARAKRRLRAWFDAYYGNADLAEEVCVWGSLNRVLEAIEEVVAASGEMVLLHPVFDHLEHAETLARGLHLPTPSASTSSKVGREQ